MDENTSYILHVSNTTEVNFAHLMTGSYRSAIAGDEGEGAGGGGADNLLHIPSMFAKRTWYISLVCFWKLKY